MYLWTEGHWNLKVNPKMLQNISDYLGEGEKKDKVNWTSEKKIFRLYLFPNVIN